MQDAKKSNKANLERRRKEIFLLSLLLALSVAYCALEWSVPVPTADDASLDDIFDDIDLDMLRHDPDLFAAESEEQTGETATTIVAGEEQDSAQADENDNSDSDNADETEEPAEEVLSVDANSPERQMVLERLPEFPGGATAFMKWINANIKYPKSLQTKKIAGKVVVSFVVDTEGNTTQLAVDAAGNKQLAQTVLSAMRRMPKWRPGMQNGKICATMVKVPINFEL